MKYSLVKPGNGPGQSSFKTDINSLSELLAYLSPEARSYWDTHTVPDDLSSIWLWMYPDGRCKIIFYKEGEWSGPGFTWDNSIKEWAPYALSHAYAII